MHYNNGHYEMDFCNRYTNRSAAMTNLMNTYIFKNFLVILKEILYSVILICYNVYIPKAIQMMKFVFMFGTRYAAISEISHKPLFH